MLRSESMKGARWDACRGGHFISHSCLTVPLESGDFSPDFEIFWVHDIPLIWGVYRRGFQYWMEAEECVG